MKFVDYVKIEKMKNLIMVHLEQLGCEEQVRNMTDEDLNKIMALMHSLGGRITAIDSGEQKADLLMTYVVYLWAKLVVDYKWDGDIK